jgi:hypothetical protein
MEDVGIFYGHFVYFTANWNHLLSFGIFFPLWYNVPRKIWQHCSEAFSPRINGCT